MTATIRIELSAASPTSHLSFGDGVPLAGDIMAAGNPPRGSDVDCTLLGRYITSPTPDDSLEVYPGLTLGRRPE